MSDTLSCSTLSLRQAVHHSLQLACAHKKYREGLLRRLAKAALYHGAACARFVAAAEELQAVLLSRRAAQPRPGALLGQAAVLQEACCLFACLSARRALSATRQAPCAPRQMAPMR